jgi:hypothetical protein
VLLVAGCDPGGGKPPPAQDACNRVVGDWTIIGCSHEILDGGQTFETPGGTVLTVGKKGEELLVGSGDEPARVIPNERSANRCAGPGLVMVFTAPSALAIDRFDSEFKSHCTLQR